MKDNRFGHLKLRVLPKEYNYVLFSSDAAFWKATEHLRSLPKDELYFLFRCGDESSMVIPNKCKVEATKEEPDWKALQVVGEMPFGTVQGLIASISGVLQRGNVGICAVSTYLTDVFFVKTKHLELATTALKNEGWEFVL